MVFKSLERLDNYLEHAWHLTLFPLVPLKIELRPHNYLEHVVSPLFSVCSLASIDRILSQDNNNKQNKNNKLNMGINNSISLKFH
jgi:hypothetical protein